MLSKSKASPCILTLILSFVLSDYTINLKRIKLKLYIVTSYSFSILYTPQVREQSLNNSSIDVITAHAFIAAFTLFQKRVP